jgi:hypothetical protein
MMTPETERGGYRLFVAGSVALSAVGALLIAGFLLRSSAAEVETIRTLMEEFTLDEPLGARPSMLDLYRAMVIATGTLLLGLGVANLSLLWPTPGESSLLRRLILVNVVMVALLLLVFALNKASQEAILLGIAEACFVGALFRSANGNGTGEAE